MARETRGEALSDCEVMLAGAKKYAEEPGVAELLFQFELSIEDVKKAKTARAGHRAKAQQESRDYDTAHFRMMDYRSRLRRFFQAKFGTRAEALAEFGLIPLRPAKKPISTPVPPEDAQSAVNQAATPMADSSTQDVIQG